MITSIAKSNPLPATTAAVARLSTLARRKKPVYNWFNIITYTVIIMITVVWVAGMAFGIRMIYVKLTITKVVVSKKGGQL